MLLRRTTLFLAAFAAPIVASAQGMRADSARIQRDIATLSSDRWEGRGTCTPGLDSAAGFIAARFQRLGLLQAGSSPPAGSHGYTITNYFHRYTARPNAHVGSIAACTSQNVAGIVRGTDPALANEFIIVGAHYDHLGRDASFAQDKSAGDAVRNGADDNASGTAGVLELARLFAAQPARRSIIFVTFSGEEWGILGSSEFAKRGLPAGRARAMVNFDMIGRLRGDSLIVFGTGTATELPAMLERANTQKLVVRTNPDGNGNSDHAAFYSRDSNLDVPVLHFFTGMHEDYHKASDDADKINAGGEAKVLDYAARVIRDLADLTTPLTFVRLADTPRAVAGDRRVYLGSIPDMAGSDVPGLRLSDVAPGSPADKGGLKPGDVIVEFAGKPVADLTTYSNALYASKPGDTVTVIVMRAGQRVTLSITLGTRGS